jgi:peptide chain release factor 2
MILNLKDITRLQDQAKNIIASFNLPTLKDQLTQLETKTLRPDFWQTSHASDTMRQLGNLQNTLQSIQELKDLLTDLETANYLFTDEPASPSNQLALQQTFTKLNNRVKELELRQFLSGKYDALPALFSVHAGQGGTEAMDWASLLARAYTRFFERKNWQFKIINESRGEEAGLKTISFEVKAQFAYGLLKNETGTHRLVRLSPFNADNLRQTSFALVEVLPLLSNDDKNIILNDQDLSWHFSRAGGAGGQNVNKVNTAVELTYLPLNLVIKCREQRSQEQNRQRALQILKAKLALMQEEQQASELKDLKGNTTMASWGTQIRNYVLHPYQLVKDLRTGVETNDTTGVLDGDLDQFITASLSARS